MDILIVEDEILLGLVLADALADVGHRVLGPASCRAEALELIADRRPHLALVDVELRGGESGIELAGELRQRGVPCAFATGQPDTAREHRDLALGLVAKPYSPATIAAVIGYFEALGAGRRSPCVPRGLELFSDHSWPVQPSLTDAGAAAVLPCGALDALATTVSPPSAAAISAGLPPQAEHRPGDAGVLEALTG